MRIRIYNSQELNGYSIELEKEVIRPGQFESSVRGEFGVLHFRMAGLPGCVLWLCYGTLRESLFIKELGSGSLLQLCCPLAVPSAPERTGAAAATVVLRPAPEVQLPAGDSQLVFLHYGQPYTGWLSPNLVAYLKEPRTVGLPPLLGGVVRQLADHDPEAVHGLRYLKAKCEELYVLLQQLLEGQLQDRQQLDVPPEKLDKIKEAIRSHLQEPLSPYALAKMIYVNVYTLRRDFRRYCGQSLEQYLLQARMEEAHRLLTRTTRQIQDIAWEVGYKNGSNFTEAFRRYYGYPPRNLRNKN